MKTLTDLSVGTSCVRLLWVMGHSNINRNEEAAKQAATAAHIGPEPALGLGLLD